ncbi:hypothetical protein MBLNU230_g3168t1 [Neophaeotheca triangularis]
MLTLTSYPNFRPIWITIAAIVFCVFLIYRWHDDIPSISKLHGISAANATLGFGGLFVVSAPASPRRTHLQQAAAITELQLTIPQQVEWNDEHVREFQYHNETYQSVIGAGSVKAWLSHHLVLRAFLESGLETALIFEDDVDWDIRLRTLSIPLAQKAARSLATTSHLLDKSKYPWGTPTIDWDLLYLGHCGDYLNPLAEGVGVGHHHPNNLTSIPHALFPDPSLPDRTDLHPFTASLLTALDVPPHNRVLHKSRFPLCSFGYAITRRTAQALLTTVAPPHEDPSIGLIAYDAAILSGCRDAVLPKCFTLQPELFHHMEGESMIAGVEVASGHEVHRPPVDQAGLEQVAWRRETSNVGCGFWSGEFWFESGDLRRFEWLRENVGRRGRCVKPGREK